MASGFPRDGRSAVEWLCKGGAPELVSRIKRIFFRARLTPDEVNEAFQLLIANVLERNVGKSPLDFANDVAFAAYMRTAAIRLAVTLATDRSRRLRISLDESLLESAAPEPGESLLEEKARRAREEEDLNAERRRLNARSEGVLQKRLDGERLTVAERQVLSRTYRRLRDRLRRPKSS